MFFILSRPSYQKFSIRIDRTNKENTDEYKWTFQHLRNKHTDISMNYDLVDEHANNLNDKLLKDFKDYIENEIINSIGGNYVNIFSNVIWKIIENSVKRKMKKYVKAYC